MDIQGNLNWMCLRKYLGCRNLHPAVYTEWKPRGKVKPSYYILFHQGTTKLII